MDAHPSPTQVPMAERFKPFGTTIFSEMTALAQAHGAINLSQGFPDFDGPGFIVEAAKAAMDSGQNQYARSMGAPALVEAAARSFERHYGRRVKAYSEVGVYSGATEGLLAAIMGMVNPGDEVILFEPYYDSYRACLAMAGATPRYVTLRAPDFSFDPAELEAAFTSRTRLLLLNTPHNPTGKVFSREELGLIAELCQRHDVLVLTDQVYEHLTFDGVSHIPLATLPGMWERTLTLSSTGKTFSMTGWKIGYAIGPAPMVAAAQSAHQFITFATATPFQAAMAAALDAGDDFYRSLKAEYAARRDFLLTALGDAGLSPLAPQGTYFAMVDVHQAGFEDDVAFAKFFTAEVGVACIPTSVFYATAAPDKGRLARFAFCKRLETLERAAERLRAWGGRGR